MTIDEMDASEAEADIRNVVEKYWRYRKRTARSLIAVILASIGILVLDPSRWASDETGTALLYGAWGVVLLMVLLAFRWNGEMAERHGYCIGKYGRSPQELAAKGAVSN